MGVKAVALSAKQQLFIDNYLISYNATQSAIAAGYSQNTATEIGYENLRKPHIAEAIQRRLQESAMSADEVLMRLAEHARGDLDDVLNSEGDLDIKKARRAKKTRLIKKWTRKHRVFTNDEGVTEETTDSIEMYDAQAALVHLGKHHKLFTDKQEITGKDGGPIEHDHRSELLRKLAALADDGGRTVAGQNDSESTGK